MYGKLEFTDKQLMEASHGQARNHHDGEDIEIKIHHAVTGHGHESAKKTRHFDVVIASHSCLAQGAYEKPKGGDQHRHQKNQTRQSGFNPDLEIIVMGEESAGS